jgi:Fe2+ or Zn2+ uptake regulation protein
MSQGRSPTVSDSDIVEHIKEHQDPAVTTKEICAKVDIGKAGTYSRLEQLKEDGVVVKKDVGSRAVVWWVAD